MNARISVVVLAQTPARLQGLVAQVLADDTLSLVAAVANGRAARGVLEACAPGVLLVQPAHPDREVVELIRLAATRWPRLGVLVVTALEDPAFALECLNAGSGGYLTEDGWEHGVAGAIHELHHGGAPVSADVARWLLAHARVPANGATVEGTSGVDGTALSEREVDILRLLSKGLSFADAGRTLEISPHTVASHVKKIYRKLAVHSRAEAVYEAQQSGLL